MPSLISRIRRGSEGGNKADDPPSVRGKRLSIDIGQADQNNGSPKSSKFKSIFGAKQDDGEQGNKMDSLRKKLTSPSTIFKTQVQTPESAQPVTPPSDDNGPDPALAQYSGLAPQTPPRNNGARFPSPATSPQQFALSRSRSPGNGSGRDSWTPSYPLVVPDDSYADISPDGHAVSPRSNAPSPLPVVNENSKRRSMQLDTSKPLSEWQPIQPDRPKPLNISPESGLPTPPTSTESREELQVRRSVDSGRPALSLETDTLKPSPLAQPPQTGQEPGSNAQTPTPLSSNLTTPTVTNVNGVISPPKPVRQRTNLITSPPMPQPIKNLPTLSGWSGFPPSSPATPRTPGWGSLAREGGPKTPGGMMSPRTPGLGSGGFPFMAQPLPRQTSRGPMSDGELRKAKRAMPVMLREPSFKPPVSEDGEVGASDDDEDDDEESEPEVEGAEHGDSEDETETERAQGKGKGKKKAVPLRQRLTGKGKQKTASSPGLGIAPVSEEPDSPPASGGSSSMWSLPTPKEKTGSSIWAQFRSGTPGTPSNRPGTNDNTRSNSYQTDSTDSYFGSQPGSSVNITTASLPLNTVQNLNRAPNVEAGEAALEATVQPVVEVEEEAANESDETSSSHDHSSLAHASPQPPAHATLPDSPQRPAFFSQVSQSMVNLGSSTPRANGSQMTPAEDSTAFQPRLQVIRSRENAPGKIDIPQPKFTPLPGTPGAEWAKPPPTPAAGFGGMFWNRKEGDKPALKRRRSAGDKGDMDVVPPEYSLPLPGVYIPKPRDEEGREKLPAYWCAVHIEGNLSRKQEFSAPGVQARDRSWKKLYFILRGTALFVYKFDPHRFPLKSETAVVPTTTEEESEENLHVHLPGERRLSQPTIVGGGHTGARRGSLDATPTPSPAGARRGSIVSGVTGERRGSISGVLAAATEGRRGSLPGPSPLSAGADHARRPSGSSTIAPSTTTTSTANSDAKDTQLFNPPRKTSVSSSIGSASSQSTSIASHFQQNQLLKVYTLQNAESGLAADYIKRKNVVRVRSEGEQFLLQTDSARDVVDWIEAFQSATNVALDLDDRPMPKIITLPRRRRRRVAGAAAAGAAGAAAAAVNASDVAPPTAADTPEGNAAAVAAAERASRDMDRMLGEDQAQGAERT